MPDDNSINGAKNTREEAEEEYNIKKRENTYKRLMHLVNQSRFFSKVILDKANEPNKRQTKVINPRKRKTAPTAEVVDDSEESRLVPHQNYDYSFHEFISDKIQQKVKEQERMHLNTEHMEEAATNNNEEFIAPKYFEGELYPYQKNGLQWLKALYENGLNGILADEMGLGKTIQIIALIAYLIEINQEGPYLIVVPLSTLPNWLSEFKKFSPLLPVVVYYGTQEERKLAAKKIGRKFSVDDKLTQPIILTTYEVLKRDESIFGQYTWCYIVLDEGQKIKNYQSQIAQCVQKLESLNRIILTGTPLQNNLTELWSLLHFLLPDIFDDLDVFESWFNVKELENAEGTKKFLEQEKDKHVVKSVREILRPFMKRRLKKDVDLEIPPMKEILVYAPMTKLQRDLYSAALNRNLELLQKVDNAPSIIDDVFGQRPKRRCEYRNKYSTAYTDLYQPSYDGKAIQSASASARAEKVIDSWKQYANISDRNRDFMLHLPMANRTPMYREIVNHPYLIHCPLDDSGLPTINEDLVKSSGKLMILDVMLKRLHADGHKVLLFSTMKMLLDIIGDYLNLRPWTYVMLDGTVDMETRKINIDKFNNDPDVFLFLITTRAGGIGLNLAAADTVILYDSDWNPQADIQAMARCHRIGQTRPVVVYRLCTKATIDETIVKRAEAKRKLEKMVINKEIELSLTDRETLLEMKRLLESSDANGVTYAEKGGK